MRYYQPLRFADCVYSVDKLILNGKFLYNSFDSFQASLNSLIMKYSFLEGAPCDLVLLKNTYYVSKRKLSFMNNFSFELTFGGFNHEVFSFWLGTHFQTYEKTLDTWKLELNPNKCMPCEFVSELFFLLKSHSKMIEVSEFDLAVDIPILREDVFLIKDNRKYSLYQNSQSDKTEYLGSRHTQGFVKLYNKQLEQKLKEPLTRFEMTCTTFDVESILHKVPTIYILKNQLEIIDLNLNATDLFILKTLLSEPSRIVELGRYQRIKIEKAMEFSVCQFDVDKSTFYKLISYLKDLPLFFTYDYERTVYVD